MPLCATALVSSVVVVAALAASAAHPPAAQAHAASRLRGLGLRPRESVATLAGVIDATAPPYSADPTGATDATAALQAALSDARNASATVLLPHGVYRVTQTVNITSLREDDAVGLVGGTSGSPAGNAALANTGRSLGFQHTRPVLWVPQHTPAFAAAGAAAFVVHLWRTESDLRMHPNGNFDQVLQHVDIHVAEGNPAAVGVRHRAAQHSAVDNVTVVFDGDVGVGVQSLPGSGGFAKSIAVFGGHVGLDLRNTQPTTPVVGLTLVGQACAGVVYSGQQSLVLAAANITVAPTAAAAVAASAGGDFAGLCNGSGSGAGLPEDPGVRPGPPRSDGQVVMVDSILSRTASSAPRTAAGFGAGAGGAAPRQARCAHVWTDTSVVLRNVWLRGCNMIVNFTALGPGRTPPQPVLASDGARMRATSGVDSSNILSSASGGDHRLSRSASASQSPGWTHADTVAVGVEPLPTTPSDQPGLNRTAQYTASVYAPDRVASGRVVNVSAAPAGASPPLDVLGRHGSLADAALVSFRNPSGVLVTDHGAKGDGVTDDVAAFERAVAAAAAAAPNGAVAVVVVPAGAYVLSRTLALPDDASVAVVGLSLRQSTLTTSVNASDFDGPMIRTGAAPCVLRDLALVYRKHQASAYAVEWLSRSAASALSQVRVVRCCVALASRHSDRCVPFQVNTTVPAVQWRGSGAIYSFTPPNEGFRWSAVNSSHTDVAPSYRYLLFDGAVDSRCYACDPESQHRNWLMDAAIEVRSSTRVRFFGTKSEGPNTVVWARDSHDVGVYGHGGMGTPPPFDTPLPREFARFPPSLFRVTNSTGVEIAHAVDRPVDPATVPAAWDDPGGWAAVAWSQQANGSGTGAGKGRTGPLDRPAFVRLP